jgi:hypothetical protein
MENNTEEIVLEIFLNKNYSIYEKILNINLLEDFQKTNTILDVLIICMMLVLFLIINHLRNKNRN